jgi:uncharacterized membrane protein YdjX (TVP38/TMEM64 family)
MTHLHHFLDWIAQAPPVGLFAALVLLPLVGIPVSPVWIAVGIRMGTGTGTLIALAALLLNFTLAYGIATRFIRGRFRAWLEKRGKALPAMTAGDETRWIVLVRIAPGFPLFLQNYLLGMAGVGFLRYLIFSLPIQGLYAFLFISLGTSLSGSGLWRAVLAASGLVAAGLLVSILRRSLSRSGSDAKA